MRVSLNGYVVADDDKELYDWFDIAAFSPRTVREAIEANPPGEELVFEINSGGGNVFDGFEMYSVLRSARGKVKTCAEVQSIAASAASTLMLGCDTVMLSPVAQVMIHNPSAKTNGDVHAHEKSIEILDSIRESILNAYELRCGGKATRDELRDLIEHETWLPAHWAVRIGLADGILYEDEDAPILPRDIMNAIGGGIRAFASSGVMPTAAELRARYEAETGRNYRDDGKKTPTAQTDCHVAPLLAMTEKGCGAETGQLPTREAGNENVPETGTNCQKVIDLERERFKFLF